MLQPDQWVLEDKETVAPLEKWQKTVDVMARVFNAPAGFIVQYNTESYQVLIASDQESNPYPAGVIISPETNIFCKKVVEENHALYVPNAPSDPFWDDNPEVCNDGFRSYLGLPITWPSGEPFGTICVMDYKTTDYHSEYVDLMSELRDLVEADLKIMTQFQEISSLAMTDELTGLYNRRGFMTVTNHYQLLAERSGMVVGLFFLDLDGLKTINDTQGHAAGDQALISLANVIKTSVRENDITARLSGDEFVIMAAAENEGQLALLSERISHMMGERQLGVSIGYIVIDAEKPLEHWLQKADTEMYRVKKEQ